VVLDAAKAVADAGVEELSERVAKRVPRGSVVVSNMCRRPCIA
jgi:hypothetical protein